MAVFSKRFCSYFEGRRRVQKYFEFSFFWLGLWNLRGCGFFFNIFKKYPPVPILHKKTWIFYYVIIVCNTSFWYFWLILLLNEYIFSYQNRYPLIFSIWVIPLIHLVASLFVQNLEIGFLIKNNNCQYFFMVFIHLHKHCR